MYNFFTLYLILLPVCAGSLTSQTEHACRGSPTALKALVVPDLNESFGEEISTQNLSPSREKVYPRIEESSEVKPVSKVPPQRSLNLVPSAHQAEGNDMIHQEESIQLKRKNEMQRFPVENKRHPPAKHPAQRKAGQLLPTKPSIIVKPKKRTAETDPGRPQPKRVASHEKETGHEAFPKISNLHDWNFVRGSPRDYMNTHSDVHNDMTFLQNHELEEFFKEIKFSKWDNRFFYIRRKEFNTVMTQFQKKRHRHYSKIPVKLKTRIVSDIVLQLSEEKLGLDDNQKFSNLIAHLASRTVTRNESTNLAHTATKQSPHSILRTIEYFNDVNKITIFLILIHLSIFHEHDGEELTAKVIEKLINFLENLWNRIEGPDQKFLNKHPWAEKNSLFFSLESDLSMSQIKQLIGVPGKRYHMAWNFVEQWAEDNGKSLKWGIRTKKTDQRPFVELVNYILLYSNPSFVAEMIIK
ncbi:hypothetical protein Pst134EA_013630 [Puccinia striiformis f. sp. tritici]|uniref:hypothetical protein n=1 Tax=Puccinia striiformis f. sp. tritici TaxID=168172 RepID=UPI0020075E5B|nr:hypothetical protein Pst134EA_013630 [Puccinia striiformis f. sp. tritici]KAH9465763.1 hypothetical protein Pst134EA_013630 [Puccinia striiformis f. sp. tritici]